MDALAAIRSRRSIRKFTGEAVPREVLETLVDSARLAASGNNQQPWEFIIVTGRAMIQELCVAAGWMEQAGAIIVVIMDSASRWWIEDASAAVENLLIAATALGYGACWLEGNTLDFESRFKALLNVPERKRLFTLIPVGVPAEAPQPQKKPLEALLHWETYRRA